MENYTKYALKPAEELNALLAEIDDIFVISCNKCFKEFDTLSEPEMEEFLALAEGKNITGTARADFLCNSYKAQKNLAAIAMLQLAHPELDLAEEQDFFKRILE